MRAGADKRCVVRIARKPLLSFSSFILSIMVGIVSSFTFTTAYDMARDALLTEHKSVSGVWQGQWLGVHAVTIRIFERGERLCGTARFSKVVATSDGPKVVGVSSELPLINPQFDGERLLFEVRDAGESLEPVEAVMEMNIVGEGEAELRRTKGLPEGEMVGGAMIIRMRRERSF